MDFDYSDDENSCTQCNGRIISDSNNQHCEDCGMVFRQKMFGLATYEEK